LTREGGGVPRIGRGTEEEGERRAFHYNHKKKTSFSRKEKEKNVFCNAS